MLKKIQMKTIKTQLLAFFLFIGMFAHADEGMWFLMFIDRNFEDMKEMGLQLTPEEIYSINNSSLKDAIVQFNGGCTAEIISKEATSRGSSMHDYLEKFLLGKLNMDLLGDNTREKMMADQIIENGLRNKLSEIWGCEATLYYPGKYAGAADCIGIYENKETIIDFKQSNKPKKDEWIDDYYLQCAAYSLAHNKVHGSNITQVAILLCTKDNIFQRFIVEGERLINYQNQFLEKVEQFYSQRMAN